MITIFSKSLGPKVWVGDRSQEVIKFFYPFLYHKIIGASLLKFGPFGADSSHGAGKLAEFFKGNSRKKVSPHLLWHPHQ